MGGGRPRDRPLARTSARLGVRIEVRNQARVHLWYEQKHGTPAMTFDDIRHIALAWPEVEDGTSYSTPALKVRKKMLVRLREDGDSLVMPGVPQDERDMLVESQPKVFHFTDHYRDYPMVLIRLSRAKRATVEPLLRRQWRALASKAALKQTGNL